MEYQTNITILFKGQPSLTWENVHPDNRFQIENGSLSFETLRGDRIIYIPAENIQYFFTTCEMAE